tara:strand:- start:6329 stop:6526 length:198 start_codon:yes stop_codon:yes gene_type:complete
MKKSEMAQKIAYLVSEHCSIMDGAVGIRRGDAFKFIEGLEKLGILPPDISKSGYSGESLIKWEKE